MQQKDLRPQHTVRRHTYEMRNRSILINAVLLLPLFVRPPCLFQGFGVRHAIFVFGPVLSHKLEPRVVARRTALAGGCLALSFGPLFAL